jgi:hypothetical protein
VLALAATDPELAQMTEQAESLRRAGIRSLIERLRRSRALQRGLKDAEATAAFSTLTSFATYDQLVAAGLRGASLARVLLHLVRAVLVTPGGTVSIPRSR